MPAVGEHHPAFEEYCECIFELAEDDVDVIQARIAERLQVSRPAVSEMIRRLEAERLVTMTDGIRLTDTRSRTRPAGGAPSPPGRALPHRHARSVVGRSAPRGGQVGAHHERQRRDGDGSSARAAPPPARTATRSPGSTYAAPDSTPLSTVAVGQRFTVNRIPEELEFTPGLLDFLEESSILPGRSGVLTAASPDGTVTVEIDGRHVGVGAFASARILVMA